MFWDAATCRKILYEKNKTDPLSEKEIYAATRIQYRIDPIQKKTIPHTSEFRHLWILMFEAVGEYEP